MTNIYAIDEALNKYAEDHGNVYPEDLSVVIKEGYMKQMIVKPPSQLGILTTLDDFPVNPLSYTSEPMRQIKFGDPDFEGNFTYIPVEIDGELKTYYLFCYAPRLTQDYFPTKDVDGDGVDDYVLKITHGEYYIHDKSEEEREKFFELRKRMPLLSEILQQKNK